MQNVYVRSALLRAAGAVVAIAAWLGIIVLALNNLDTGLPRSEGLAGGWPFWLVALIVTVIVARYLGRNPGRPGWFHFVIGLLIPEIAFAVNRLASTEISALFWVVVAALVLVPLPGREASAVT